MRVATANTRAQVADFARSRAWTIAAAGVVVIGTVATFVPPAGMNLGAVLERASIGMRKPQSVLAFSSTLKLDQHFTTIGYNLDAVRNGGMPVPRIFLARVPDGLADVKEAVQRKEVFLRVMLPLILEANERVQQQRAQLLVIDAKLAAGQSLTREQNDRLKALAAEYSTDPERIDLLLQRVDAVPPSLALAAAYAATVMRLTRSAMLDVLRNDYVRTAWAKGLRERQVMSRHAIKNAMIPVVTFIGLQIITMITGAIVIEQVFNLNGVGKLLFASIFSRDYAMVQGLVLFFAVTVLMTNLAVDLVYGFLDPRVRYS